MVFPSLLLQLQQPGQSFFVPESHLPLPLQDGQEPTEGYYREEGQEEGFDDEPEMDGQDLDEEEAAERPDSQGSGDPSVEGV